MIDVSEIRALILEGKTDREIEAYIAENEYEATIESQNAQRDEDNLYGNDPHTDHPYHVAVYNDRLDMGRNDAGEWLGFM